MAIPFETIDYVTGGITFIGGIIIKFIDKSINRRHTLRRVEDENAALMRDELRKDIETLREENRIKTEEADKWREKYYRLAKDNLLLSKQLSSSDTSDLEIIDTEEHKIEEPK